MRQYQMRRPIRPSVTQAPCMLGVGQGLEEIYDDLFRDSLPEDWKRLVDRLAERVDALKRRTED